MTEARVYLAGPEVFLPDARSVMRAKEKICSMYGFVGISPSDSNVNIQGLPKRKAGFSVSAANEQTIRSCQILIANLTPFRGPSADVGTTYELGFARALGLRVYAYTNIKPRFRERTLHYLGPTVQKRPSGVFEDTNNMSIEDFDLVDNLMLDGAIHASGSEIVVNDVPKDRLFVDLIGFEQCLHMAARSTKEEGSHSS